VKHLLNFDSKIVLITGAASGIGREVARQLCAAGSLVVAADKDMVGLRHLETELINYKGCVEIHAVDVTQVETLRKFIENAAIKHGRIDYLFNNAGIAGKLGEVRDLHVEDWDKIMGINLMATIHGTSTSCRKSVPGFTRPN